MKESTSNNNIFANNLGINNPNYNLMFGNAPNNNSQENSFNNGHIRSNSNNLNSGSNNNNQPINVLKQNNNVNILNNRNLQQGNQNINNNNIIVINNQPNQNIRVNNLGTFYNNNPLNPKQSIGNPPLQQQLQNPKMQMKDEYIYKHTNAVEVWIPKLDRVIQFSQIKNKLFYETMQRKQALFQLKQSLDQETGLIKLFNFQKYEDLKNILKSTVEPIKNQDSLNFDLKGNYVENNNKSKAHLFDLTKDPRFNNISSGSFGKFSKAEFGNDLFNLINFNKDKIIKSIEIKNPANQYYTEFFNKTYQDKGIKSNEYKKEDFEILKGLILNNNVINSNSNEVNKDPFDQKPIFANTDAAFKNKNPEGEGKANIKSSLDNKNNNNNKNIINSADGRINQGNTGNLNRNNKPVSNNNIKVNDPYINFAQNKQEIISNKKAIPNSNNPQQNNNINTYDLLFGDSSNIPSNCNISDFNNKIQKNNQNSNLNTNLNANINNNVNSKPIVMNPYENLFSNDNSKPDSDFSLFLSPNQDPDLCNINNNNNSNKNKINTNNNNSNKINDNNKNNSSNNNNKSKSNCSTNCNSNFDNSPISNFRKEDISKEDEVYARRLVFVPEFKSLINDYEISDEKCIYFMSFMKDDSNVTPAVEAYFESKYKSSKLKVKYRITGVQEDKPYEFSFTEDPNSLITSIFSLSAFDGFPSLYLSDGSKVEISHTMKYIGCLGLENNALIIVKLN